MSENVSVVVIGAGDRGCTYAGWIEAHPERARVVAVVDPDPVRRERLLARHPDARGFVDWRDLPAEPLAQAALVCTQDAAHVEPAMAMLARGYDVLLEKPIAPTLPEVERVCAAAQASGRIFAVPHVMRYTPHTRVLRELLAGDAIGGIVSVQHVEPVGWFHMAHSYVRGNWRRAADSSSMLLAKSCHDIDWLGFVVGRPIVRASSFGSLTHFRAENAPAGATARCLDCPLERTCAYSATRIYLDRALAGETRWPVSVITADPTPAGVETALREGPYGRCVYACDNDVVDHQVVALEFAGGITGTFQMMAFTDKAFRRTQIYGTQGELTTDGVTIGVLDFRTGERRVVEAGAIGDPTAGGGHGGGDWGLFDAFIAAVAAGDQSLISTDAAATLASHRAVFAIEEARDGKRRHALTSIVTRADELSRPGQSSGRFG